MTAQTTAQIGVTHTVRVECACKTCAANARTLGKTLPLVAWITEAGAATIGTMTKATAHGLVYLAHDPILGAYQSAVLADGA